MDKWDEIRLKDFLSAISPSFGYGLGIIRPLAMLLNYSDFNIMSNITLQKGNARFVISDNGTVDGKKSILIGST